MEGFDEKAISQLVHGFAGYLRQQKAQLLPASRPLSSEEQGALAGYFSPEVLQGVRIVELRGQPMPSPPEEMRAKMSAHVELPEIVHMDSFTFVDVVAFRDTVAERRLFHALVHVAQFQILGVEHYLDLYAHAFLKTKNYLTVPLEMHAFKLDARFVEPSHEMFRVEDEVRRWQSDGAYARF